MRFGSVHRDHLACLCIYVLMLMQLLCIQHMRTFAEWKQNERSFCFVFFFLLSSFALFILSLLSSLSPPPSSSTSVVWTCSLEAHHFHVNVCLYNSSRCCFFYVIFDACGSKYNGLESDCLAKGFAPYPCSCSLLFEI